MPMFSCRAVEHGPALAQGYCQGWGAWCQRASVRDIGAAVGDELPPPDVCAAVRAVVECVPGVDDIPHLLVGVDVGGGSHGDVECCVSVHLSVQDVVAVDVAVKAAPGPVRVPQQSATGPAS